MFKTIDLYNFIRVGKSGKSLKMCSIMLRHNKVQDLPYHFMNKILPEQVDEILLYNDNDVVIPNEEPAPIF